MNSLDLAAQCVREFKGDRYVFGMGVLARAGDLASGLGRRALLVCDTFPGLARHAEVVRESLRSSGVELLGTVDGAAPNAPREDLDRVARALAGASPDVVVSLGGGSTIDCVKAAEVLRTLGGSVDDYFGAGLVTKALSETGRKLAPHLAIQTVASSGAHLTKYSNITDLKAGQKKLIVDEAIVPARALFDYQLALGAPAALTADGALDGLSHCLEVWFGASGKPNYESIRTVAMAGIQLVLAWLPRALAHPEDPEARYALGLATDLGGLAIMLGGTNGAHLTSFSLIDILSHGRACAMLNPYYTVLFGPAISDALRSFIGIAVQAGYAAPESQNLAGRALATACAEALLRFEQAAGIPTRLADVPGFGPGHIARALDAAKKPELKMKLENMPIPLRVDQVDEYMGGVLRAAATGDLGLIRELP